MRLTNGRLTLPSHISRPSLAAAYNLYAQAFFISLESKLAHLLGPRRAAEHAAQQVCLGSCWGRGWARTASGRCRALAPAEQSMDLCFV